MVVFVLVNVSRDTIDWDFQMVSLLESRALHSLTTATVDVPSV